MDSKSANNDSGDNPQKFHKANKQRSKLPVPLKQAKSKSDRLRREQGFRHLLLELDEPLPCPSRSDKSSRYRTRNRKNVDPNYQMGRAKEFKQLLEIEQPLSSYKSDKSRQQKIQSGHKDLVSSPFATKYVLLREAIMYSENKKKYDDSRKDNPPSQYVQSAPDNVVSSPAITKSVKEHLHLREATSCSNQANGKDENSHYKKDKRPRQCTRSDYKYVLSNPERTKPVLLREATWTIMQRKNRKKNVDPNYHTHRAEEFRQPLPEIEQPLLSSYKSDKLPQQSTLKDMVSNPAIAKTKKEHLLVRKATSCIEQAESKKNHVDAYYQKRLGKSKNVDLDYQMRRAEEFQELLREIEQPLPISPKGDQSPRYHSARTKRKSVDPNYQKRRLEELRVIVSEIENQLPSSTERNKSPQCDSQPGSKWVYNPDEFKMFDLSLPLIDKKLTKEEQDIVDGHYAKRLPEEFQNLISDDEKLFGFWDPSIKDNIKENQLLAFGNPAAEADRDQNQLIEFGNPSAEADRNQNQLLEFGNPPAAEDRDQNQLLQFGNPSAEADRNQNQLIKFGNPSAETDSDQNHLLEFGNPTADENMNDNQLLLEFGNPPAAENRDQNQQLKFEDPCAVEHLNEKQLLVFENLSVEADRNQNQLLEFGNPSAEPDKDQNQLLKFGNRSAEEDRDQNQLLEFGNPSADENMNENQLLLAFGNLSAEADRDQNPLLEFRNSPAAKDRNQNQLPESGNPFKEQNRKENPSSKENRDQNQLLRFWNQSSETNKNDNRLPGFWNPPPEKNTDHNRNRKLF